jgi:hypothetical protein
MKHPHSYSHLYCHVTTKRSLDETDTAKETSMKAQVVETPNILATAAQMGCRLLN